MAHWMYTLDIVSIWKDKEMSTQDKGKAIAEELRKMVPKEWVDKEYNHNNDPDKLNDANVNYDPELVSIIQWFMNLDSYHGHSIISEFNGIMGCLYDWADQTIEPLGVWPRHAMCWIKTQSHM